MIAATTERPRTVTPERIMPNSPKGARLHREHADNVWFWETYHDRYRVRVDEIGDPFIPLKGRLRFAFAVGIGKLGIWINTEKSANQLQKEFRILHLAQHGDQEHIFHWPAGHADTERILERARAYRRRQMSAEQKAAAVSRARHARGFIQTLSRTPKTDARTPQAAEPDPEAVQALGAPE